MLNSGKTRGLRISRAEGSAGTRERDSGAVLNPDKTRRWRVSCAEGSAGILKRGAGARNCTDMSGNKAVAPTLTTGSIADSAWRCAAGAERCLVFNAGKFTCDQRDILSDREQEKGLRVVQVRQKF